MENDRDERSAVLALVVFIAVSLTDVTVARLGNVL